MAVDDAYTISLLHFDGADGSTTIVDESGTVWLAAFPEVTGPVELDTAKSKWGTASLLLPGPYANCATESYDSKFNLNGVDFTVDFQVFIDAGISDSYFIVNIDYGFQINCGKQGVYSWLYASFTPDENNYTEIGNTTTWTPITGQWFHVTVARVGNTVNLHVNGTIVATGSYTGAFMAPGIRCSIGKSDNDGYNPAPAIPIWIDEFRISKGIARWTENFTSPVAEYAPITPDPIIALDVPGVPGVAVSTAVIAVAPVLVTNTLIVPDVPVESVMYNPQTIIASAGTGGAITPSGTIDMSGGTGTSKTFNIAANAGYEISNIIVDGISIGVASSYTFTNIAGNHTIEAQFSITEVVVVSTSGRYGSISPAGQTQVEYGADQTFTITPELGSEISEVVLDGVSVGAVDEYTLMNVVGPHTLSAYFTAAPVPATAFDLTIEYLLGGSIVPYTSDARL